MTFADENIELGVLSMGLSMLLKVLFGVTTLAMFFSVYIKIKIIYEQRSAKEWNNKYKRIVHGTVFSVLILNILFSIIALTLGVYDFKKYQTLFETE